MLTGLAFTCRECKKEFSEEDIRFRLDAGKDEISCQRCGTGYSLFAASETETPESRKALVAFKTDVEQRTQSAERKVAAAMAHPRPMDTTEPRRILHLSDLHFTEATKTDSVLQPLAADLRDELGIKRLDYVVVSGDFADKCNHSGFDAAREFLGQLTERFGVNPLKTILVPGNHDLSRETSHFDWASWKADGKYEDVIRLVTWSSRRTRGMSNGSMRSESSIIRFIR